IGGSDGVARPSAAPACAGIQDDQVWVPGGLARFGSDAAYPDEGPAYEARIKGFWIDRHEVTNRQFAEFTSATGHITQAEREGGSIVFDPPGPGEVPVEPSQW